MLKPQAWDVSSGNQLAQLEITIPDLEANLEDWIEKDAAIVASDLLIIGRQVTTGFGTFIDLLGISAEGDLVIIELKRGQTLRETVAQALEYAAWCSQLGYDEVIHLASEYYKGSVQFREAFKSRHGCEPPETLNQAQRIILVAPEVSDSTRAVIEYLSETYSVPINAVTFAIFRVGERSVLVRHAVLTEEETAMRRPATAKSRPAVTIEELLERAGANGVREIAELLWSMHPHFLAPWRYTKSWAFALADPQHRGKYISAFTIWPTSETMPNAVVIGLEPNKLSALSGKDHQFCRDFVNRMKTQVGKAEWNTADWQYLSLRSVDQTKAFMREISALINLDGKAEQ